jgi:hypothetical protein
MAADDRRHPPMTIPTVPPRSRIRIGTTSILVRIRHVLTGMIIGRRLRIGRVNPGMVREDGTTIRAAGQVMARVVAKANGNPAMAPAGDQGNRASRDRVVLVEGLGNRDKAVVRANPDSRSSRDRADVRVSPVSLDRADVRVSPDSRSSRGRADARVSPDSLVNLGRADVRVSPDSRSSRGRADARVSPDSLVLARPANRHSSPPGRKAPLPRPKSRSRDNRRSRDNQGSHLIRKDLVHPNNFWANLLS